MKKMIFLLLALFLTACQNSNITKIQEGFLDFDKSVSIGYALGAYKDCKDLSWSFETKEGKDLVIAKCDITDVAKQAVQNDEQKFRDKNLSITADYIKIFKDNFTLFKNIYENFVFIINKDESYELDKIEIIANLKDDKQIILYSSDKFALMDYIYKNKTLMNDDIISTYTSFIQGFFLKDEKLKEQFLNFQSPLKENEKIDNNSPFGLKFGNLAKDEIFKIPCNFEELKFKNGVFENNGYYLTYNNCSLLKHLQSLELGFDDEKRLIFAKAKFNGSKFSIFNDVKNGPFETKILDSKIVEEHGIELPFSYSAYYINKEFYDKLNKINKH